MYAIVSTGGKQYKVAKGDVIDVEKLDADASALAKKKVTCTVVEQFKGEKQLVFKFKKRKRYHRCNGHRQNLTKLEVSSLPRMTAAKKADEASDEQSE